MPKLTRIEITNFLGLEHLAFAVPPAGAIIAGGNKVGKSSILKAISAALAAQGVGPEAIRIGADKAEILVDLDAVGRVRKAITPKGDSVSVTTPAGDRWARPQSRLDDLLGTAALDPLEFFLAPPAKRKEKLLAAMPMEVTAEDLLRWTGDKWQPQTGRHGLEVLDEVGKHYYDLRRDANKAAADLAIKYAEATAKANAFVGVAVRDVVVPPVGEEDAPVRAAEKAREEMEQRTVQSKEMERRTAGTRSRIEEMRREADAIRDAGPMAPPSNDVYGARDAVTKEEANVQELQKRLALATSALRAAQLVVEELRKQQDAANDAAKREAQKRQQANELEASLTESAIVAPASEECAAVDEAVNAAHAQRTIIRAARAAQEALASSAKAEEDWRAALAKADALDTIVTRLNTDAPLELAKRAETIPGLAVSGDGITLDGKALDNLSGAEAMAFAVDLAKRLNRGAKILRVDKLEQLDPDTLEQFVAMATADDFQLIGTRVEQGELAIYAIESGKPRVKIEVEAEKPASA
jgi:hypothetical protein